MIRFKDEAFVSSSTRYKTFTYEISLEKNQITLCGASISNLLENDLVQKHMFRNCKTISSAKLQKIKQDHYVRTVSYMGKSTVANLYTNAEECDGL